ncbi:MAG TPA: hypothetical protein VFP72_21895, partial [Kineosporiaceae bacterium]|nr:hypothetical protein [Kineosporiaceae bacterium]
HDNGDVRPVLALLDSPAYRQLPVVVLPQSWWLILLGAYRPDLPARAPLAVGPALGPDRHIVLHDADPQTAARRLAGVSALAAVVCTGDPQLARQAAAAFPALRGFQADQVTSFDGWSVVLLHRAAG